MFKLVVSNFLHRPIRALTSVLSVAVSLTLVLVCVGMAYGQLDALAEKTRNIAGDLIVQPAGASLFFGLNSATMEQGLARELASQPGVAAVTPVITKIAATDLYMIYGIDPETFLGVTQPRILQGRMIQAPDELMLDQRFADRSGLGTGTTYKVLGHDYKVVGVFDASLGGRVLMHLGELQKQLATPGRASMFFIKLQPGVAAERQAAQLLSRFPGIQVTLSDELKKHLVNSTPVFREFVTAVVVLAALISFLVVLLASYTAITERTREIGILKSLGLSSPRIFGLVVREAVLTAALGILLGYVLTFLALRGIAIYFPRMPVVLTLQWKILAPALALIGGVVGSAYPAYRASRMDPVRALSYE